MKKTLLKIGAILPSLFWGGIAAAEEVPKITPSGAQNITEVIDKVIDWALGIGGLIAVLVLVIGGIRYIVAAGNETQIKAAKNTIIYALIGLVIIILAWVIVRTIITQLGR